MRGLGHIIVDSKAQPSSETQIENFPGPIPDESSIATVILLVVVLGSTHDEKICNGETISKDCSSVYDGPACSSVVPGGTESEFSLFSA